jgi:hypothetical protein
MKTFTLLFLSLFLANKCDDKKVTSPTPILETVKNEEVKTEMKDNKTQDDGVITYEAFSRGYFMKVTYSDNELVVLKDRNSTGKGEVVKISKEDIVELNSLVKAIKLEELQKLKGPTEKRFFDGAAHANLRVNINDKEYTTQGFDAGVPPKEIEKMVLKMLSLAEKK